MFPRLAVSPAIPRWAAFLATLVASATAMATAEHGSDTVELSWTRSPDAEGCISLLDLKHAVQMRLRRDPFAGSPQQQIEGHVIKRNGRWVADIVAWDATGRRLGSRRLDSVHADCSELDQAVVLTVTLIIDPNATLQPPDLAPAPAPIDDRGKSESSTTPDQPKAPADPLPPETATAPIHDPGRDATDASHGAIDSPPKTQAAPTPPSARSKALPVEAADAPRAEGAHGSTEVPSRLVFAPSVVHGLLPGTATAVALRSELNLIGSWTAEVSAIYFPERKEKHGDYRIGYGLTLLALASCYQPRRPLTLLVCGGGLAGVNHTVVHVGEPYRPGDRFWGGLRADIGISATAERLVAELRAFAVAPLTRWRFETDQGATLFEQPLIAPGAEIAVGLRLP